MMNALPSPPNDAGMCGLLVYSDKFQVAPWRVKARWMLHKLFGIRPYFIADVGCGKLAFVIRVTGKKVKIVKIRKLEDARQDEAWGEDWWDN